MKRDKESFKQRPQKGDGECLLASVSKEVIYSFNWLFQ